MSMTSCMIRVANLLFSRKKMIFYEYPYHRPDPWQGTHDGLTFRALLPQNIPDLEQLLDTQRALEAVFIPAELREVEKRFIRGEGCYVCERQGKIVGYSWFAREGKHIPEIRATLILGPGDLYLYNSYVIKDFRRQNVVGGNLNAARKDFIPQGFSRVITATMSWNKAAGGSLAKLNFSPAGSVTTGYFLTFRYMINTCGTLKFTNETSTFELYRKLCSHLRKSFKAKRPLPVVTEERVGSKVAGQGT